MRSPRTTRRSWFFVDGRFSAVGGVRFLLGAILLLCASLGSARADSVPDWLAAANRVDLNHFGDGSPAVIVEQWDDFTVDATGKFVSIERKALRVLDRRSADRYLSAVDRKSTRLNS